MGDDAISGEMCAVSHCAVEVDAGDDEESGESVDSLQCMLPTRHKQDIIHNTTQHNTSQFIAFLDNNCLSEQHMSGAATSIISIRITTGSNALTEWKQCCLCH